MAKKPSIPHEEIVQYILDGHSSREAQQHFGFANENITNLRIHAAFKSLDIQRPRYAEQRVCEFCGVQFMARDYKQRTCGNSKCQESLIIDWQRKHPESSRTALKKYRKTDKGRQNNIRMHRRRRDRGLYGSLSDQWNFATTEIKKSLRKLKYMAFRNPWEYRLQHVQKLAKLHREFRPRNKRTFESNKSARQWSEALRSVQTTLIQKQINAVSSEWEKAVNRINRALRSGHKVRAWKRK